jgi:hypothetical protein
MAVKTYNKTNFHKYTFCIFQEVASMAIADLQLHYKSKSGSSYYFTNDGVYRMSNHWGRAANCKWRLIPISGSSQRIKVGYARWSDFYPDNDFEKLYCIEVDYATATVHFNHKQSTEVTSDTVLRTALETTKLIKQIRSLLEETAWAKYLKEENIDLLRKAIIDELVSTNKSFMEIRKGFM